MTHRERVLAAMHRELPDRPPFDVSFTPSLQDELKRRGGGDATTQDWFDTDVRGVGPRPPPSRDYRHWYEGRTLAEGTTFDVWGVAHEPGSVHHFKHKVSPLAGRPGSAVADYEMPARDADACFAGLTERVSAFHAADYAVTGGVGHIYESAWQIRGYDAFLVDMALDPDPMHDLLERITVQNETIATRLAAAGVDILMMGDDVANQNAMMFSPDAWRTFLKPRLARIVAAGKRVNPDVLAWYHSDGNIEAIIPELIEIGIDILNPLQPECMDLARIRAQYGDQVAFWGCIGTQSTMPFGTADDVRRVVRETLDLMGPGLLVAPTHVLEPEVPWDNIVALAETVKAHGSPAD